MEPTHLHRQVENATAPSAGGSSDPHEKSGWETGYLFGRPIACDSCNRLVWMETQDQLPRRPQSSQRERPLMPSTRQSPVRLCDLCDLCGITLPTRWVVFDRSLGARASDGSEHARLFSWWAIRAVYSARTQNRWTRLKPRLEDSGFLSTSLIIRLFLPSTRSRWPRRRRFETANSLE